MEPVVATNDGRLCGVDEHGVLAFRGIPYARPPVGPLRFMPPEKPAPWIGIRDADTFGPMAMQGANPVYRAAAAPPMVSEDCLYLNVWTPAADYERRPVLVWLHGGAFLFSAGSQFNGARLAARGNIVVVTLNYRLGLFGFLRGRGVCGEPLDSTGNEGLLDQLAALEWVRDEIAGFGGDPGNVTLAGQSAGATSAAVLSVSPRASGLLHKVVQQSGCAALHHTPQSADGVMHRVLTEAGLTPRQGGRLRDMPAEDLLDLQQRATPRATDVFYRPVADGDLIPEDPFAAVAQGASAGIPLLCGTNLEEMKFQRAIDPAGDTLDDAALLRRCGRIWADNADVIVETYRTQRRARGEDTSASELWFAIASDHRFRVPAMRQAELHSAHTPQTYAYLFTWRSPAGGGRLGAAHGVELGFVFGRMDDPRLGETTEQIEGLSAHMMDRWIAFAHKGQPDVEAPPAWPRYTAERRATMLFGDSLQVDDAPLEVERAVWTSYAFGGGTPRA